jgi:hypothetical protein
MSDQNKLAAFAIAILLIHSGSSWAAEVKMVSNFHQTCVAARSLKDLKAILAKDGWKAFASLAESHLEREINLVTPMLEAQGLSSDYTIYGHDAGGRHFELALSETKKPLKDGRKLIGCSLYDFTAVTPIDPAAINSFAPAAIGQKNVMGDAWIEKWDNPFGEGSGMRAVFIPPNSPVGAQLGFTGMMLGTHFLDTK